MYTMKPLLPAMLAAALALGAAATAQTGSPDCTHLGIKPQPSKLTTGPIKDCSSGLLVQSRGIPLRRARNLCPLFVIYQPPRDVPTPRRGYNVKPGAVLPLQKISMDCATDWLFGFLPIPIGESCKITKTENVGTIQSYVQILCDDPDTDTGQEE